MRTEHVRLAVLGALGAAALATAVADGAPAPARATAATPTATRPLSATGFALRFNTTRLRAPAGRVRLVLRNRGELAHNVALRGRGLRTERIGRVVGTGGVSRITVTLKPGRYTFFCSVFGHEDGGMRGTLVVPAPRGR